MKTAWLHKFVNDLDPSEFFELSEAVGERQFIEEEADLKRIKKLVETVELTKVEQELIKLKDSKIQAVKALRDRMNLSLLDAKLVVDAYHKKLYPPCPRCGSTEEICPC